MGTAGSDGLRVLLIHIGLKQPMLRLEATTSLRVLLIHIGLKPM